MDLIDVIHDVSHSYKGGVEALAARMGKSADTLRKKVLPTNDTHELTVKELRKIVDYCDTDRIAQAFAEDRGLMCIQKHDYEGLSDKEILDLFLDLQAKQGQWAREISIAMQDGSISWDELKAIRHECNKFITAIEEIMCRLEAFMGSSEETNATRLRK